MPAAVKMLGDVCTWEGGSWGRRYKKLKGVLGRQRSMQTGSRSTACITFFGMARKTQPAQIVP